MCSLYGQTQHFNRGQIYIDPFSGEIALDERAKLLAHLLLSGVAVEHSAQYGTVEGAAEAIERGARQPCDTTWLVALLAAIGLFLWGKFVPFRATSSV